VHRLTNLQSVLRQNAMIREYRILSATSLEDLQEVVQKAIIDGWQPQGGVALALASSQYAVGKLFAQAIVRSWPPGCPDRRWRNVPESQLTMIPISPTTLPGRPFPS